MGQVLLDDDTIVYDYIFMDRIQFSVYNGPISNTSVGPLWYQVQKQLGILVWVLNDDEFVL